MQIDGVCVLLQPIKRSNKASAHAKAPAEAGLAHLIQVARAAKFAGEGAVSSVADGEGTVAEVTFE